jgi:hypothetical protein
MTTPDLHRALGQLCRPPPGGRKWTLQVDGHPCSGCAQCVYTCAASEGFTFLYLSRSHLCTHFFVFVNVSALICRHGVCVCVHVCSMAMEAFVPVCDVGMYMYLHESVCVPMRSYPYTLCAHVQVCISECG